MHEIECAGSWFERHKYLVETKFLAPVLAVGAALQIGGPFILIRAGFLAFGTVVSQVWRIA